jgi:hypothetical protein
MGVPAPGLCMGDPLLSPHRPLRSHIRSFGTLGQFSKIPPIISYCGRCKSGILIFLLLSALYQVSEPKDNFWNYPPFPLNNAKVRGVEEVPNFVFDLNPNIFLGFFLKLPPFSAQKCHSVGGSLESLFVWNPNIFVT